MSFVVEIEWNSKSGRLTTDENPNSPYPTSEPTANNHVTGQAKQFLCIHGGTIGISAHHVDDYASIINLIQSLPANSDNRFQIRTVTLKEVILELRNIRSDCSTGPDNIPANMI